MSLLEWLDMGGYAAYVWPAYAAGLSAMAWNLLRPLLRHRRLRRAAGE